MNLPTLSIIIPAYEYEDGIKRILKSISLDLPQSAEILIFDNSVSDRVKNEVKLWSDLNPRIYYRKNSPTSNPASNWTDLVDCSGGEYCLLLHHDEFPISSDFILRILDEIHLNRDVDVLMMDCILVQSGGKSARRHLPNFIRSWVVKKVPEYLFRRNVIGPTASLVVRRKLYPKFDDNLRWLVDVDVYYQLRRATGRWKFSKTLQICSMQGRSDSITADLGVSIPRILREEQAYLVRKYPEARRWLHPDSNRFRNAVEAFFWYGMRVGTLLYGQMLRGLGILPVNSKDLRKSI